MKRWLETEDALALAIGLGIFALSLSAVAGIDLLGWGVTASVWLDPAKAVAPVSKVYAGVPGWLSLLLTYFFTLVVLGAGARMLRLDLTRFALSFSAIFWLSYLCWLAGNYGYIAATPDKRKDLGLAWSLGVTGEAGFLVALVAGLVVGNLLPAVAGALKEAVRPELYIKTAIVILGASLGVQAAGATGLATAIMFRGFAAIVEAYLIYWALVYLLARTVFGFSREWAAPLASGISICGVSAAIATGAAIRARPIVPIMVSSLVVIFSVFELLVLPFAARTFLSGEPMVAAAWMGLAVKTDGAAVASGAVTEALIRGQALAETGTSYKEGWMLLTTTTVKVFIDVFIGVWAFVLALIWVHGIDKREGETVKAAEIWQRFPKFVLGYLFTFFVALAMGIFSPGSIAALKVATAEANVFRVVFFVMTFYSIGLVSNFGKLRQEGIGRLTAVYVVSLFGFILWIGLAISWIFFHGVHPPLSGAA